MPLPTTGSLTLQGHSRPGEGITAKPKQAMIVRMSEDTLDALQDITSEERMDFMFGDNPGIYIRDVFFPMRASYETTSHELFIRTTKAQRPSASLRLNADVFGRFDVERDLSEKLTKRIHDSSVAAAKQKTERKVVMLDAPLVGAAGTKKGKAQPKNKAKSLLASSSTKPSPRISSPLARSIAQPQPAASSSSTPLKEGNSPIRARLVHFLALGSQSTEEVVKVIGGGTSDLSLRTKIVQVLEDVAEKELAPKNAAKLPPSKESWRLKQETWLDVRPHQYADYTDNERVAVARTARVWLKTMKIPDADPAWEHVRYRANGTSTKPSVPAAANPSTPISSTTGIGAMKASADFKGVRTKEVKEKKPKPIALAEMKIKSEATTSRADSGSRPSSSKAAVAALENGHGKDKEWEEGELAATPPRPAVTRKPPAPKSATPQGQNTATSDPQGSLKKRTGPVDARAMKKEPPPPSESARPAPPLPPPTQVERRSAPIPKIIKKEKEHVVPKDIERARDAETRKLSAGTKRKQPSHEYTDSDDEESSIPLNEVKRKKLADGRGGSSAVRPVKEEPRRSQDSLAPPKKPVKRESSPASLQQQVKPRKDGEGATSSRHVSAARSDRSTTGSGSKLRRKSPIYTSSDDEEAVKPRHAPKPAATQVTSVRARAPAPLPLDHAGLRARYNSTYMEYLGVFTKVVAERTKIESVLKRNGTSSGGVTDSEGDTDMLSAGELEKLSERHRSLHEELLSIKQAWGR
ncbi:hypothetical protein BD410DRAFT_784108 [Rickenella mellea]|uniref:RNA polymerase II elongation factor ELL N-terminal domain-containing protein n=1 Tax=Rickenella mellea TaxID=50990 RepID=A0A4Y7QFA0_9AGAM|nr:hypothetical protein BD410DRAFT_784108 [Rickenella mellea]